MSRDGPISAYLGRRHRISTDSGRYSRFVGLMKVVLPMSAVSLTALVIAWPYLTSGNTGLPIAFSSIKVQDADSVYMTNARYFGADDDQQPFSVVADTVTREIDNPNIVHFTLPRAEIQLRDGSWMALFADHGTLLESEQSLSFAGGVSIFSDQGYEFQTERAEVDLRTNVASGSNPVEGQGPLGLLNAQGFSLDRDTGTLRFEGGVRVVVTPNPGM